MSSPPLYPFVFRPVLKRYLWGGRRLGTSLGKPIGPESDYAESWEIADHQHGQSIVADGPLAGTTLHELVVSRGEELLGRHFSKLLRAGQTRFPLIFKFLDCQRDLSVQVHPDDDTAARLDPPDLGKTEAWLILDAQPGSRVYVGLREGCTQESLAAAIHAGKTADCLHSFEAGAGQCIFVPAGTVHALGAGLLVAEIQQASDTTYRLYDWDRVGPDGKPRALHVEQSLATIDYKATAVMPRQAERTSQPHIERLVACDKFVLDRWRLSGRQKLGGDNRFHLMSVLEGSVTLRSAEPRETANPWPRHLTRGQTILLPATVGAVELESSSTAVLLDMYLPE
jgi:mannose-6-phosphate isomerase